MRQKRNVDASSPSREEVKARERKWIIVGIVGFLISAVFVAIVYVKGDLFAPEWSILLLIKRTIIGFLIAFAIFGFLTLILTFGRYVKAVFIRGLKLSIILCIFANMLYIIPFPYNLMLVIVLFVVVMVWAFHDEKKERKRNNGKTDNEIEADKLQERLKDLQLEQGYGKEWIHVLRGTGAVFQLIRMEEGYYFIKVGTELRGIDDYLVEEIPFESLAIREKAAFFIPRGKITELRILFGSSVLTNLPNCAKLRFKYEGKTQRYTILMEASEMALNNFFRGERKFF